MSTKPAEHDSSFTDADEASNRFKLGVYLAATGVGFSLIRPIALVGVVFLWVGLALASKGPAAIRWSGALLVAAVIGWCLRAGMS